jgi:hypothetical protein
MARAERVDERGRAVYKALLRETVTLANMIADGGILRAQDYAQVAKAYVMLAEAWVQLQHSQEGLRARVGGAATGDRCRRRPRRRLLGRLQRGG